MKSLLRQSDYLMAVELGRLLDITFDDERWMDNIQTGNNGDDMYRATHFWTKDDNTIRSRRY